MTVKQNIKMFLNDLSINDKIEVLKELYKDIAELGVEGDTELAHINTFEANLLRKCGGSGTLNPNTGLPQYSKGGGGGTPQATFQNTNQFSRIPDEVAPFASDVLTEAQDYYRMIMNQGYDPYTGAVTAPQTAEQTEAQAGLSALGRGAQGTALQQESLDLQRQQGEKFTPEVAQEYMSPYQRAVTDIEKRKATEDFDRNIMPRFEKQAVDAGGMSGLGSRAGVQAGILGEGLQTRLGDIEAKGLQSSFLNAQQQFQNQKQRENLQSGNIANLGPAMFSQGVAQQGALQTVGEQKQTLGQKGLDEQYFKFLEQKAFPEEQLAKYSGFVYGNPLLSQRNVTTTQQAGGGGAQAPSSGSALLGTGLAAAGAFKQIAPQTFGSIGNTFRGALGFGKTGGGLSDIVYRAENGQTSPDDELDTRTPARAFLDRQLESLEKQKLKFAEETREGKAVSPFKQIGAYFSGDDPQAAQRISDARAALMAKRENEEGVTKPAERKRSETEPVLPPGAGSGGVDEGAYADASGNIIVDRIKEVQLAAQKAAAEKAAKAEKLARLDLGTVEGIEASAVEQSRILTAAADMNKRIRTNARGEIDRTGMILQALSNSLLKSVSGDPRDPASTRGSMLLRIADGLNDGTVSINEAEAAMKKLERVDAELEIKDLEKVTKIEQGKTASLGSLPAKLRALAIKQAAARGLSRKQASERIKNEAVAYKNAMEALVKIQADGGEVMVNSAYVAAQAALAGAGEGTKAEAIKNFVNNLGSDERKTLVTRAYQKQIDGIWDGKPVDIREAVLRAAEEMALSGMEAKRTNLPFANNPPAQFPDSNG